MRVWDRGETTMNNHAGGRSGMDFSLYMLG